MQFGGDLWPSDSESKSHDINPALASGAVSDSSLDFWDSVPSQHKEKAGLNDLWSPFRANNVPFNIPLIQKDEKNRTCLLKVLINARSSTHWTELFKGTVWSAWMVGLKGLGQVTETRECKGERGQGEAQAPHSWAYRSKVIRLPNQLCSRQ